MVVSRGTVGGLGVRRRRYPSRRCSARALSRVCVRVCACLCVCARVPLPPPPSRFPRSRDSLRRRRRRSFVHRHRRPVPHPTGGRLAATRRARIYTARVCVRARPWPAPVRAGVRARVVGRTRSARLSLQYAAPRTSRYRVNVVVVAAAAQQSVSHNRPVSNTNALLPRNTYNT